MQLSGIPAIAFVLGMLCAGCVMGMSYTTWLILLKLKAQGYTLDEKLNLQVLQDNSVQIEVIDDAPEK